ncbi:hypothetical protein CDAR_600301, partial [Caerostris darwini]
MAHFLDLDDDYLNSITHKELDNYIIQIQSLTLESINQSQSPIGTKKTGERSKNAIWWNPGLRVLRSKVRASRRLYQKETDAQIRQIKLVNYKNLQAIYKRNILNRRRECFKDFANKITTKNLYGKNFKVLLDKTTCNRVINPVKDITGQFTSSLNETMFAILKHHFGYNSLVIQLDNINSLVNIPEDYIEISIQEIEEII